MMTKEVVFIIFFSFQTVEFAFYELMMSTDKKNLSNLSLAMNTNYLILSICRVPTLYVLDCSPS